MCLVEGGGPPTTFGAIGPCLIPVPVGDGDTSVGWAKLVGWKTVRQFCAGERTGLGSPCQGNLAAERQHKRTVLEARKHWSRL